MEQGNVQRVSVQSLWVYRRPIGLVIVVRHVIWREYILEKSESDIVNILSCAVQIVYLKPQIPI
jgi:hypothetical protein